MIDSMTIKTYKINENLKIVSPSPILSYPLSHHTIEKLQGRILFCANHWGSNGYPRSHFWILATTTLPAFLTWEGLFKELLLSNQLTEIDIEDEYYWIHSHLNKQVRFYIKHAKFLISRVLFEKYQNTTIIRKELSYYDEILAKRREQHLKKPTFFEKVFRNLF